MKEILKNISTFLMWLVLLIPVCAIGGFVLAAVKTAFIWMPILFDLVLGWNAITGIVIGIIITLVGGTAINIFLESN